MLEIVSKQTNLYVYPVIKQNADHLEFDTIFDQMLH